MLNKNQVNVEIQKTLKHGEERPRRRSYRPPRSKQRPVFGLSTQMAAIVPMLHTLFVNSLLALMDPVLDLIFSECCSSMTPSSSSSHQLSKRMCNRDQRTFLWLTTADYKDLAHQREQHVTQLL